MTEVTVKVNVTVFDPKSPSLADTIMTPLPLKLSSGVNVRIESVMVTIIFPVVLIALNDNESPSTSDADNIIDNGVSSGVIWLEIASSTGASLTGVTVRTKVSTPETSVPSLAVTLMVAAPLKLSPGVIVSTLPVIKIETADVSLSAV